MEHLLGLLAAGEMPETSLREYPFLEPLDIQAYLAYAHRSVEGERVHERIAEARAS